MNVRKKEDVRSELKELIVISGGSLPHGLKLSVEDLLHTLRTYIVYNRFDLKATKRELRDAE